MEHILPATEQLVLNNGDLTVWTWLIRRAITQVISGLSSTLSERISVDEMEVKHVLLNDVISQLGNTNTKVVTILLRLNGDQGGQVLLAHDHHLVEDLSLYTAKEDDSKLSSLRDIETALLEELGAATGFYFLNAISDATNLSLSSKLPEVVVSQADTVVRNIQNNIAYTACPVHVIKVQFRIRTEHLNGIFLVIPTADLVKTIVHHARSI